MASTLILLLSFVVISVQGSYVWQDDDDHWPGHHQHIKMPNFYFPPLPPPLPIYLPLPPYPKIPAPGEIKNMKGGPGEVYAGVALRSVGGVAKDKDGKKIGRSGATIVTNVNGEVNENKLGDSPPNIDEPIVIPAMPKFQQFPTFQFPEFAPIVFEPIEPIIIEPIKPIDPEEIRKRRVKGNENYVGVHTSSYAHSSNINGKKSSGGGTHTLTNVNGKVDEQKVDIGKHDKC